MTLLNLIALQIVLAKMAQTIMEDSPELFSLEELNSAGYFYRKQLTSELGLTMYGLNKYIDKHNIPLAFTRYIKGGWHSKQDALAFYHISNFAGV